MLNPGQSSDDAGARGFLQNMRLFRAGRMDIEEIFHGQREVMPSWGHPRGRFAGFYIEGIGLGLDEVAFANVSWCGTAGNKYPGSMLRRCFEAHTGPLLRILKPDVVLASGRKTHAFGNSIRALLPGVTIVETLHYAHRAGRTKERREVPPVAKFLQANFVVVKVPVGQMIGLNYAEQNVDLVRKYRVFTTAENAGIPSIVILDSAGNVLGRTDKGEWRHGDAVLPENVIRDLRRWAPKR